MYEITQSTNRPLDFELEFCLLMVGGKYRECFQCDPDWINIYSKWLVGNTWIG